MKVQCKNCLPEEGIELPDFTQSDKESLTEMKLESPVKTVKLLMSDYKLSQRDSKYIVTHINKEYGKCKLKSSILVNRNTRYHFSSNSIRCLP